jgi:hypothetical protein
MILIVRFLKTWFPLKHTSKRQWSLLQVDQHATHNRIITTNYSWPLSYLKVWCECYSYIARTVWSVSIWLLTRPTFIMRQTQTQPYRNGKDENLIGNAYGCKRLEVLLAGFAQGLSALTETHRTRKLMTLTSCSCSIQSLLRAIRQENIQIHWRQPYSRGR